jgi:hypothetical protein
MSALRDGFKMEVPHSPGCFFDPEQPADFILYDGMEFTLKRNGHKGGSTMWHRFSCNSPIGGSRAGCAGRLLVRWDVINDLIRSGQSGEKDAT